MTQTGRRLVHNSRERVRSADPNRLQAFMERTAVETLRYAVDAVGNESSSGGLVDVATAPMSPMRGTILSGLLVRPSGAIDLAIDAGAVLLRDGDTVPDDDDSQLKRVIDPGMPANGTLQLTAGTGAVRVDVVECARIDLLTESDNREIFDPSTGLFTPASVPKVAEAQLTYRIRTGTPGGGFAGLGHQAGWMPLAVLVVGSSAVDWTGVQIWDVRPLMSDHVKHPRVDGWGGINRSSLSFIGGGTQRLNGVIEAVGNGRHLGGRCIDLDLSTAYQSGFSGSLGQSFYIYLLTPFGLPRWCRYGTNLLPGPVRGVPVVSLMPPNPNTQAPFSGIALPTAYGLGGSTAGGVAVAAAPCAAGGTAAGNLRTYGKRTLPQVHNELTVLSGAGTLSIVYQLAEGVHVPQGARCVRVRFVTIVSGNAPSTGRSFTVQLHIRDASNTTVLQDDLEIQSMANGSGDARVDFEADIPLGEENIVPNGLAFPHTINIFFVTVGLTYSNQVAEVVNYQYRR